MAPGLFLLPKFGRKERIAMGKAPTRGCQLCGQHKASRVTADHMGNACWYCGYCQRWQPAAIGAFLHAKRIFAAWKGKQMKPSQQMQQLIEALTAKHGVAPLAVDAVLKLTLPAYMPLVLRNVGV